MQAGICISADRISLQYLPSKVALSEVFTPCAKTYRVRFHIRYRLSTLLDLCHTFTVCLTSITLALTAYANGNDPTSTHRHRVYTYVYLMARIMTHV